MQSYSCVNFIEVNFSKLTDSNQIINFSFYNIDTYSVSTQIDFTTASV